MFTLPLGFVGTTLLIILSNDTTTKQDTKDAAYQTFVYYEPHIIISETSAQAMI